MIIILIFSLIGLSLGYFSYSSLFSDSGIASVILLIVVGCALGTVFGIMVNDKIKSYRLNKFRASENIKIRKKLPTQKQYSEFNEEQMAQYNEDYYNGAFAHAGLSPDTPVQEEKPKFTFKHSLRYVYSIIGIVIVYGVINLVLYGGQELFHSGEKNRLKEMEIELSNAKQVIEAYESKVTDGSISDNDYIIYTDKIDEYNEEVKEYNKLAEKAGTSIYLIPGIR